MQDKGSAGRQAVGGKVKMVITASLDKGSKSPGTAMLRNQEVRDQQPKLANESEFPDQTAQSRTARLVPKTRGFRSYVDTVSWDFFRQGEGQWLVRVSPRGGFRVAEPPDTGEIFKNFNVKINEKFQFFIILMNILRLLQNFPTNFLEFFAKIWDKFRSMHLQGFGEAGPLRRRRNFHQIY